MSSCKFKQAIKIITSNNVSKKSNVRIKIYINNKASNISKWDKEGENILHMYLLFFIIQMNFVNFFLNKNLKIIYVSLVAGNYTV